MSVKEGIIKDSARGIIPFTFGRLGEINGIAISYDRPYAYADSKTLPTRLWTSYVLLMYTLIRPRVSEKSSRLSLSWPL